MKSFIVKKSKVKGNIKIPPSKSETLRAILFGALAKNKSEISSYLNSNDTKSMIEACRLLGAKIKFQETQLEIEGINGHVKTCEDVIHAGNSGIVLRFCTAIAALSKEPIVITGDHSIRYRRPMNTLLKALSDLNVKTISIKSNGFAPLIIQGPIKNLEKREITVNGEDSQNISALLIASLFTENGIEIAVKDPGEKPWVALTLNWFDKFNIPYQNEQFSYYKTFGNQTIQGFQCQIPGDLSSAAYPVAAALITNSELLIENVDMNTPQGDKALIYLFQKMGGIIEIDDTKKTLLVKKGGLLSGVNIDINDFIDCITILAVVACFAEGETHILNCKIAREKECDRLFAITKELKKMGADIEEKEDSLLVKKSTLKGALLNSHQDHRMCMSLAVAAFGAEGETKIVDVACVNKSYPQFLQDFQNLKADITLIEK